MLSSQTKEDVLFAKHQRADEGGAKEVRMMIMGPDPAQDNLTVRKLLSDTEAPVTQLAEESFGSSLSKSLAWCVAVVDDERRVDLGSRQFANNLKTIPRRSCLRALA